MAWVAKFLEVVVSRSQIPFVGRNVVDEREDATPHEHSERFYNKCAGVLEVMRRKPAGDTVSALARAVLKLTRPRAAASFFASASIASVISLAVTRATSGAKASAVWPAPVAISSTRQEGLGLTSSISRVRLGPRACTAEAA